MSPNKSLDRLVDEMVSTDIDFWKETKDREAEQMEWPEE